MNLKKSVFLALAVLLPSITFAEEDSIADKRAFGVLPNYRTVEPENHPLPLSTKQKFAVATKDSFDWPILFVAGALSGIAQAQNSSPSFGQGMSGYGKRYLAGYADQAISNYTVEAVLPSILHQDPRFYRKGSGSGFSRAMYAASRVLITRTDSGHTAFNISEIGGNAMGVAVSNLYYKDGVNAQDNAMRLFTLTASDALGNVLKEFWPDVKRKFRKHRSYETGQPLASN